MGLTTTRIHPSGVVTVDGALLSNKEHLYKLVYIRPDEEIKVLFDQFKTNPSVINNFEFKQNVIKHCLQLYGDVTKFIRYQLTVNRFVHGVNQEFLLDTLRFIYTGKRNMMLSIWVNLLEDYPDMSPYKEKIRDTMELDFVDKLNSYEGAFSLISEWVSKENGIIDLLYTTFILFGKSEKVVTGNK